MRIALSDFGLYTTCRACGHTRISPGYPVQFCQVCGRYSLRDTYPRRPVLTGRWWAPWTWRVVLEAPEGS